jgi:glycosyltransferase involved in cell wall biosynthesis
MSFKFSILITTKNRLQDLIFTLNKINSLISRTDVECLICDDGSNDGTMDYIKEKHPNIIVFRNEISKGLIFSRNSLLEKTTAKFAISIDDDLHFITMNPLEIIESYFETNSSCGLVSFRIFWSKDILQSTFTKDKPVRVKSFAGGAHALKMSAWNSIPNYPDWFVFYGEEDFAAYHLFKKNIEIHYLPEVLVHHRVDVAARKNYYDYQLRQRRSFRSGWYLYFLFYPLSVIPKKLLYTLWIQIKTKTLKGDFKATAGIVQAVCDVILNFPKLLRQSNRLTSNEYQSILKLPATKLYWKPEDET